MGKIGDLWVRLGLKSDDYKKGMKDAKKETQSFSGNLNKMKAGAIAVWGAIGTSVVKFTKDLIASSNKISDAWAQTWSGIKAGYHSMLADIGNFKLKDFFKNPEGFKLSSLFKATEAAVAAKEAEKAFDKEFELVNSIRLQKQEIQQELNELYAMIRDTTLSPADRKAAMEKYKSLLKPLADAEIAVYTETLDAAVMKWQAGNALSRAYSTAELKEFFMNYGTDPSGMTAKYGELASVYENRKNDTLNQEIFDWISKLQQASNEMSNLDKEMSRAAISIKKAFEDMFDIGGKKPSQILNEEISEIKKLMSDDWATEMQELSDSFTDMGINEIAEDMGINLSDIDNEMKAFLDEWKSDVEQVAQLNQMLSDSFVSAFGNGMQALTDLMMGIEGADMKSVMAAFLAPFADTMKQMGSMIMSEGIAMTAFKKSFSNPAAAIAAGAALIAVGSAVSSGLQRLTANPTGGSAGSTASTGSYGSSELQNYESTLTVEVVGRISGNDIVISGKKTNDYNAR